MSSLTKEELRNALVNHGVSSLPPLSAKKDELVLLYEKHVAPLENGSGEFSSDDEISLNISPTKRTSTASKLTSKLSKSGSKSPKKKDVTEENSLTVNDVDVDALEDDELFSLLKKNGIDVGPIVASTRPFYKKKLALVLKGESMVNTSNGDEYSDTDPETEPEDDQPAGIVEETQEPSVTRSKTSSSSKSPKKSPAKLSQASSFDTSGLRQRLTMDEADSGSPLTPTPRRSIHSYKVTETTKQIITRNKDGLETSDIHHTIERSESNNGGEKVAINMAVKPSSRIASFICSLLKIIIFCSILFIIYVVATTPTDGVTPVDQIMDAINSAQSAPDGQDASPPPPPNRESVPEAANVADV